MNKLGILFLAVTFITVFSASNVLAQDCEYWETEVGVDTANYDYRSAKINKKDPKKVMEGIECLLKLEGDKTPGSFSGASSLSGPVNMPESTVEICALYYISSLFYQKQDHANAIVLRYKKYRENSSLNSDEAVKIAFESYRKWFEKVKEIGLEEARKQKLDPLEGSGVRWY